MSTYWDNLSEQEFAEAIDLAIHGAKVKEPAPARKKTRHKKKIVRFTIGEPEEVTP